MKSKYPEKEGAYILASDPEENVDQQRWIQKNKKNAIQFNNGWLIGTTNDNMAGFGDIKSSSSSAYPMPHEVTQWKYRSDDQWLTATSKDLKIKGRYFSRFITYLAYLKIG